MKNRAAIAGLTLDLALEEAELTSDLDEICRPRDVGKCCTPVSYTCYSLASTTTVVNQSQFYFLLPGARCTSAMMSYIIPVWFFPVVLFRLRVLTAFLAMK